MLEKGYNSQSVLPLTLAAEEAWEDEKRFKSIVNKSYMNDF